MNITFYDKIDRPWTFLHVPKTAGKSISAYIMKHSQNHKTLHPSSHATFSEMKELDADLGTTFAVFRNPYSRAVSLYRFLFEVDIRDVTKETTDYFHKKPDFTWHDKLLKEYGKLDFLSFCKELPWMPLGIEQYKYLPVDKKLRYEHLSEDSKFLHSLLGANDPIYRFNRTGDYIWQTYYDGNDAQEIIYNTYKEDFDILNYPKDINNSSI